MQQQMGERLQQIEGAVRLAQSPQDPYEPPERQRERDEATAFCDSLFRSPDAWQTALMIFVSTRDQNVRHFALSLLRRILLSSSRFMELSPDQCAEIRKTLCSWSAANVDGISSVHVRGTLALVLTLFIKREYPERWRSAFKDLMSVFQREPLLVDVMLHVMEALDDEVVSFHIDRTKEEIDHNSLIKDTMREDGVLSDFRDYWINVLNAFRSTQTHLAASCLQTVQRYIGWIDVDLILSDKFLPALVGSLEHGDLRVHSLECIRELVHKGMPPMKKTQMLDRLRLIQKIRTLPLSFLPDRPQQDFDVEFEAAVGVVVCNVGIELLDAGETLEIMREPMPQKALCGLLEACVEMGLLVLGHADFNVSKEVIEFFEELVSCTKRESSNMPRNSKRDKKRREGRSADPKEYEAFVQPGKPGGLSMRKYIAPMLRIIVDKMRYPPNPRAVFVNEEEEEDFKAYRENLEKLLVNAGKVNPPGIVSFVKALHSGDPQAFQQKPWPELEVFISLAYKVGEALPNLKAATELDSLQDMVVTVCRSNIGQRREHPVLLAFLDLCSRYGSILGRNPPALSSALQTILGPSGLRHPAAVIRNRAAYVALRLVSDVQKLDRDGSVLGPLTDNIFGAVKDFLQVPIPRAISGKDAEQPQLPQQEQGYLYELCGSLLGAAWMPDGRRKDGLKTLLLPLTTPLEKLLDDLPPVDKDVVVSVVSALLNGIGNLIKRLPSHRQEQDGILEHLMKLAVMSMNRMKGNLEIREKGRCILHHAIQTMSVERFVDVFPRAMPTLLDAPPSSPQDVNDTLALINQVMVGLQSKAIPLIKPQLNELFSLVFRTMPPESDPQSAFTRERHMLQKALYSHFHYYFSCDCMSILLDDPTTFRKILGLCYDGATKIPVPGIQKQALGAIGLLLDRCIPTPVGLAASVHIGVGGSTVGSKKVELPPISDSIRGPLVEFLKQAAGPSLVQCALGPWFDLLDVECKHVLVESAKCHLLYITRAIPGLDFSKHFEMEVLPGLGVPQASASEYVAGVREAVGIPDAGTAVRKVAVQLKGLIRNLRNNRK